MIKLIIFDFGGVLGSEAHAWETNFREILDLTGLTPKEIHKILSNHWPNLKTGKEKVAIFWKDVYKQSKNKITKGKLEKIYNSQISINKPVLNLAKQLKDRGFNLVILANASKEWINIKIKKFHLNKIFTKIYSSSSLGFGKPKPEAFTYVLNDLKVKAADVVFIDNQKNNIKTAKKLGIRSILFKNLKQLKKDLSKLSI